MKIWSSPLKKGQYVLTDKYGWVVIMSDPVWIETGYGVRVQFYDEVVDSLQTGSWEHLGPSRFVASRILEISLDKPKNFPETLEEEFFEREGYGTFRKE